MVGKIGTMSEKKPWYQRYWYAIAGFAAIIASVIYSILHRGKSPAEKILEIQDDTEKKIEKITDAARARQADLNDAWKKERERLAREERVAISNAKSRAHRLESRQLKREVLDDLDDPL
jgi:vacuolar-type H+-ATPase subunit E/Vma4